MTYQEVLEQARTCMGKCRACPVCNGLACKNTIPGPGAKGLGTGAIRSYQKWQELCVNMDTICENSDTDTTYDFFGQKLVIPVMAGPVGAVTLHYGDKFDDLRYNNVLVDGCAKAGILAFTGDGTNPAVMEGAADALKAHNGCGVPTVKPWNLDTIRQKMDLVKAADPCAIAMDIDAAGLPFLKVNVAEIFCYRFTSNISMQRTNSTHCSWYKSSSNTPFTTEYFRKRFLYRTNSSSKADVLPNFAESNSSIKVILHPPFRLSAF